MNVWSLFNIAYYRSTGFVFGRLDALTASFPRMQRTKVFHEETAKCLENQQQYQRLMDVISKMMLGEITFGEFQFLQEKPTDDPVNFYSDERINRLAGIVRTKQIRVQT